MKTLSIIQTVALVSLLFFCGAARSCVCCETKGCLGGFTLNIVMEDGEPPQNGFYDLYADVDGIAIHEQCMIEEFPKKMTCTGNGDETNSLFVYFWLSQYEPYMGFHAEYMPADDGSVAGPEHVVVRVELEDEIIGEDEWIPEYERDRDYWGHEDCGYCDLVVEEELTLTYP